ncbi:MAG: hypothetical protein V4707_06870 [Pseudomonadota bacterium]
MSLGRKWNSPEAVLVRQLLTYVVMAIMGSWFAWGMIKFPDAPIHLCSAEADYFYPSHPNGYCGKQGQSHTAEEFGQYRFWEASIFSIWFPGIVLLAAIGYGLPKRNRRIAS